MEPGGAVRSSAAGAGAALAAAAPAAAGAAPGLGCSCCQAISPNTSTTAASVIMSRRWPRSPAVVSATSAEASPPASTCSPRGPISNTQARASAGTKPSSSSAIRVRPTQSGAPVKPSTTSATCSDSQPMTT